MSKTIPIFCSRRTCPSIQYHAQAMASYFPTMGENIPLSTFNPLPSKNQALGRKNAVWTPQDNQIFIIAYETVIADDHRNRKRFTRHGWNQLIQLLTLTPGMIGRSSNSRIIGMLIGKSINDCRSW
ncbi:uncharacterized protein LOC111379834 [Olea europaea var. sylvestris]|uniref:uncharacterized protein LOC111379834 n=1 Tax=Olea europaea var. sylvestris TaxID=158386 RepID=UPI000C1D0EDC|nr:uncharacterized protein LOC111379834 [Olea europaea var. sylvestris]